VLLARHGQTVSNREGRFCGHSETDLTELGRAQARALGLALAETNIDNVYTSDYSRAIETAALVMAGRNATARIDPSLREIHYGEWEMRRGGEVAKQYPVQYKLMRAEDPAWRPEGGENVAEVRARMFEALRRIAKAHAHETTLVVAHGSAVTCLLAEVLGMSLAHTFRIELSNCGLSEIVFRRTTPVVHRINETAHLAVVAPKRPAARA
jgi:broad specificity phosphatase PhoE